VPILLASLSDSSQLGLWPSLLTGCPSTLGLHQGSVTKTTPQPDTQEILSKCYTLKSESLGSNPCLSSMWPWMNTDPTGSYWGYLSNSHHIYLARGFAVLESSMQSHIT
jgi:hypothetical protein